MAAVDYFLKIDGIDGESVDGKQKGTIDVESWSWGMTNASAPGAGGAGRAGQVAVQDFSFVAPASKASPKLAQACASGTHIKKAVLTVRKAGGEQQEYYVITMTDLLVSSYKAEGPSTSADLVPTDQVSLNFSKIEIEYRPQRPDGRLDDPVTASIEVRR